MAIPTELPTRRTFLLGSVAVVALIAKPPRKAKTVTVNDGVGLRDAVAFPGVYAATYTATY